MGDVRFEADEVSLASEDGLAVFTGWGDVAAVLDAAEYGETNRVPKKCLQRRLAETASGIGGLSKPPSRCQALRKRDGEAWLTSYRSSNEREVSSRPRSSLRSGAAVQRCGPGDRARRRSGRRAHPLSLG